MGAPGERGAHGSGEPAGEPGTAQSSGSRPLAGHGLGSAGKCPSPPGHEPCCSGLRSCPGPAGAAGRRPRRSWPRAPPPGSARRRCSRRSPSCAPGPRTSAAARRPWRAPGLARPPPRTPRSGRGRAGRRRGRAWPPGRRPAAGPGVPGAAAPRAPAASHSPPAGARGRAQPCPGAPKPGQEPSQKQVKQSPRDRRCCLRSPCQKKTSKIPRPSVSSHQGTTAPEGPHQTWCWGLARAEGWCARLPEARPSAPRLCTPGPRAQNQLGREGPADRAAQELACT